MAVDQRPTPVAVERPQDKVFLSDANPHYRPKADTPLDLRARILLHALLADQLVIGDSQSLTNPMLRRLVTATSGNKQLHRPHDLAALLQNGVLRIARRDSVPSFVAIRDDQYDRGVDDVPPREYAEWLDEVTKPHLINYTAKEVERSFKERVLKLLGADLDVPSGTDYDQVLTKAIDWIREQDVLYYKALREWSTEYPIRSSGALEGLEAIEGAASIAYETALPDALKLDVAAPRNSFGRIYPADEYPVLAEAELSPVLLLPFVLGRLPIEVVIDALASSDRKKAVAQLDLLRRGEQFDQQALLGAISRFSEQLHDLAIRSLSTRDPEAIAALQAREAYMRLRLDVDPDQEIHRATMKVVSLEQDRQVDNMFKLLTAPIPIVDDPESEYVSLIRRDPVHPLDRTIEAL